MIGMANFLLAVASWQKSSLDNLHTPFNAAGHLLLSLALPDQIGSSLACDCSLTARLTEGRLLRLLRSCQKFSFVA